MENRGRRNTEYSQNTDSEFGQNSEYRTEFRILYGTQDTVNCILGTVVFRASENGGGGTPTPNPSKLHA